MFEIYRKKVFAIIIPLFALSVLNAVAVKAQVTGDDLKSVKYWFEAGEKMRSLSCPKRSE